MMICYILRNDRSRLPFFICFNAHLFSGREPILGIKLVFTYNGSDDNRRAASYRDLKKSQASFKKDTLANIYVWPSTKDLREVSFIDSGSSWWSAVDTIIIYKP